MFIGQLPKLMAVGVTEIACLAPKDGKDTLAIKASTVRTGENFTALKRDVHLLPLLCMVWALFPRSGWRLQVRRWSFGKKLAPRAVLVQWDTCTDLRRGPDSKALFSGGGASEVLDVLYCGDPECTR